MADYQKMYAVLCGAIDDVLEELQAIPLAQPYARKLYSALLTAEDIYIDTARCPSDRQTIIRSKRDERMSK